MERLTLLTKNLPRSFPTAGGSNPTMRADGLLGQDGGRKWAGDPYDEGMVSDPDEAFAKFAVGGEDTEAWLDKNDDGTLIGWVREGAEVYRYSDPEAWAMDVDGASMARADAAPVDPNADPNADPAAADPNADPAAVDPIADEAAAGVTDENGDPIVPAEGFAAEEDPAATEADPTTGLHDPTNLPDNGDQAARQTAGDPAAADPNAAPTGDPNTDPAAADAAAEEEFDNPFAELDADADTPDGTPDGEEPIADPDHDPDNDENARAVNDPDADGDAEGDNDDDGDGEPLDENGKPKKKKGAQLFGKVQVKHLPGKHNQQDHGDWADHLPGGHFPGGHRGSGSADPKGGKPAGGAGDKPKPEPKKASLNKDTVKALDDETLKAITEDDALYDYDTMLAAAAELDSRDDVDARTRGFAKHTEPGSPERQALFDAVIPDHWSAWVAQGSKGRKPKKNKRAEIEQAYQEHVMAQYQRALEATNGYFFNNKYKAGTKASQEAPDELAFFDGRITRSQFKKYASEELSRFFGDEGGEQRMTFSDFAAEFYPSYAKAKAKVGSRYLTEHG